MNTTKEPLLTRAQKIGWGLYVAGSGLAIDVAFATGGLVAAKGALSSALIGAPQRWAWQRSDQRGAGGHDTE